MILRKCINNCRGNTKKVSEKDILTKEVSQNWGTGRFYLCECHYQALIGIYVARYYHVQILVHRYFQKYPTCGCSRRSH